MDDKDREKFYSPPEPPADDDGEYELEPPDEAVTEHQRKATLAGIEKRIDINEIYAEADRDRGSEILEDWVRNFRFRFQFQVKHLLIATALLAIVLTLFKLGMFWPTMVVLIMLGVAGLYTYLVWEEKKHQAEAARKREIVYAQRRAQQAASQSGGIAETTEPLTTAAAAVPPSSEIEEAWRAARERKRFRFQFSLREMIITMTVAAVVLGLIRFLGGPAATATVLGIVALIGLVVFAVGYDPPQIAVLGWWLVLVLYVVVSIFAAVWSSFA